MPQSIAYEELVHPPNVLAFSCERTGQISDHTTMAGAFVCCNGVLGLRRGNLLGMFPRYSVTGADRVVETSMDRRTRKDSAKLEHNRRQAHPLDYTNNTKP